MSLRPQIPIESQRHSGLTKRGEGFGGLVNFRAETGAWGNSKLLETLKHVITINKYTLTIAVRVLIELYQVLINLF